MLLEAFYSHLTGDSGFIAVAGDRLYPGVAPQDIPYPMATFSLDGDRPDRLLAGENGSLRRALIAVDCYAPQLVDAERLARAVEAALVDEHSELGSLSPPQEVTDIQVSRDHFMLFETDSKLYRLSLQFAVSYYP